MKIKLNYLQVILIMTFLSFVDTACNKQPYVPDYKNTKGYVIGKELCNMDETKDYWLVDLTYLPDTPQYGDTLVLNGNTYTNVIKTKGLDERLKKIGMKVSMDFKIITPEKVETTNCNIGTPVTYKLKELFIINQFEIK